MNIIEMIKRGESKTLELKEKLSSSLKLAKTAVAFSNTAGGKIIIGVSDNGGILGINEGKIFEFQEKLSSIIYDMCYPNILPEIYTINVDNRILMVIEIYKGSLLPYYLKNKGKLNGTYIRVGSTNRLADEKMISELERQRIGKTFDEEEYHNMDLDEIDLSPIFSEFKKANKNIDKSQLRNLKLIKNIHGKDVLTNALLIISGYFDNTGIKSARFRGVTNDVFLDKKEFDKDVFYNLNNAIIFLKNHLNLGAKINDLKRVEELEIPMVALREALLNAIIHRDYTRNSDIKVAVYDDIVEIVSPGGLPDGLTVEEVFNGRSELRNKVIGRVFKELGYVETWGSGIKRMKKICDERGIGFDFKEDGNFVTIVFHRKKTEEKQRKSGGKVAEKWRKSGENIRLTPQEEKVMKLVQKKGRINSADVEKALGVKSSRARNILSNMVKKDILKKIGRTKGSYYIVNKW